MSRDIDVNTAACTLSYIVDDQIAWTTMVVAGRPGHETPQLQASFERLVVNPPWYVPASIARHEITPKGSAYLARHHMRRVSGRIIQSPGPWAALGEVKFDMQNRYAIYLHDTPSKGLFSRHQRHLSHGCVGWPAQWTSPAGWRQAAPRALIASSSRDGSVLCRFARQFP